MSEKAIETVAAFVGGIVLCAGVGITVVDKLAGLTIIAVACIIICTAAALIGLRNRRRTSRWRTHQQEQADTARKATVDDTYRTAKAVLWRPYDLARDGHMSGPAHTGREDR